MLHPAPTKNISKPSLPKLNCQPNQIIATQQTGRSIRISIFDFFYISYRHPTDGAKHSDRNIRVFIHILSPSNRRGEAFGYQYSGFHTYIIAIQQTGRSIWISIFGFSYIYYRHPTDGAKHLDINIRVFLHILSLRNRRGEAFG